MRAFVLTAQDQRTYIFTSQDFSWLQKGQLNCLSRGSALLLGAGFLLDLLLPILNTCVASQDATNFNLVPVMQSRVAGVATKTPLPQVDHPPISNLNLYVTT